MSNDEALRNATEGKAVAMVGNLSDGFISVGPYENFDSAANAHEGDECWIKTLIPPAQWNADVEPDTRDGEEIRTDTLAEAGANVVDALAELYFLNDGDEAAVGEMMYEIEKAARRKAQDEGSR